MAWIIAAITFIGSIILWLTRRNWVGALMFFFAIGIVMTTWRLPQPIPAQLNAQKCTITGSIIRATETQETMRYLMQVDSYNGAPCHFRALLTVYSVERGYKRGDIITASGKLYTTEQFLDVPDQTDFAAYSFIDGVVARMSVHPNKVCYIKSAPSFAQSLYNHGSVALENAIVLSGFNNETASFLLATIAGDDLLLSADLSDNFRAIGLAHILALSGLHVGIIMALVAALLFAIRCLPAGRYAYYILLGLAVMCYACITGMTPSVARAAVMMLVFIVSKLTERGLAAYNSVCVTVSIWLIINPFWLWSPGLQLSVAAVIAIVWLGKKFNPYDQKQPYRMFAVSLFTIPIAAIIGTSMITVCYFHAFPIWFLPSNIIASLLAPLIIGGGAIATALTAIGISPGFLPNVIDVLYSWLERIITWFATIPNGQLTNIYPSWWQITLYVTCILILAVATYQHRRVYYHIFCMLTVLLIVSFIFMPYNHGSELYVPRISASTDILIRHDKTALLITNGDSVAYQRAEQLYTDYLGKRKATLALAPDSFDLGPFARRHNYLYFRDKIMKIITSDSDVVSPTARIDYALVGGGFKGDIVELAHTVNADTIILAQSINAIRRKRYDAELSAASIPHSIKNLSLSKSYFAKR
jgi:competence protein ComEC